MSEPFLGEIRSFSFGITPRGWAACNGQILPINQNQALFSLLGVTYGGNGVTTFALPNLQGRVPIHMTPAYPEGQAAGEETHKLTVGEMPAHTHTAIGGSDGTTPSPVGNTWGTSPVAAYSSTYNTTMSPNALSQTGGGQPHVNMQPYLTINYCIALTGIYPSRN